jgi:putative oligomerization/nucleic acid binding protein
MGYPIKAPLGLAMFFGGIVLFNVKLVSLLETGTCASGTNTPYLVVQKCPSGTGTDILLLVAGIFAGLIGAGIFAFRGEPPWGSGRPRSIVSEFSFGLFAWGFFFTATGATSLIASLTDEAVKSSGGGQLGGLIVGGTFLLMGVPALLLSLWGLLKGLGRRNERPAAATAGVVSLGAGGMVPRMTAGLTRTQGAIDKLERLQKLRESGALTDSEFEREKSRILSEN